MTVKIENAAISDGGRIAPEMCGRVGAALGSLVNGGRIGVGYRGKTAGEAMKNALAAGAQSAGASVLDFGEVMESEAVFAISVLGLYAAAYIIGGADCRIKLLGVGGMPADGEFTDAVGEILRSGNFRRCCWNEYKKVSDTNGIKLLYRRELFTGAPSGLSKMSVCTSCLNRQGERLFEDTLSQLGCRIGSGSRFILSEDGTELSIEDDFAGIIGPQRVRLLYCGTEFEQQNDIAVPEDMPDGINELANRFGRRVYRAGADNAGTGIARAQYRMRDGIMTAVRLLSFMQDRELDVAGLDMRF